jgi:hypothetical protein
MAPAPVAPAAVPFEEATPRTSGRLPGELRRKGCDIVTSDTVAARSAQLSPPMLLSQPSSD